MSKHLFGIVATPYGVAANNHGENEGNIATLQKLVWKGDVVTTVSAEAIRWALRYQWQKSGIAVNRRWDRLSGTHEWQDPQWAAWALEAGACMEGGAGVYIDDDVLGFMALEAASKEGADGAKALKKERREILEHIKQLKKQGDKAEPAIKELEKQAKEKADLADALSKGVVMKKRGVLEVDRAISLSPFLGDIAFNAKSGVKTNTSLYGTEMHATRYQYGFALTPAFLQCPDNAYPVVDAIVSLADVAGNHARFLYDFSPEVVVFRWTDDFCPRFLYDFEMGEDARLSLASVCDRIEAGDVRADEIVVGVSRQKAMTERTLRRLKKHGVRLVGVRAAAEAVKGMMRRDLGHV